MDEGSCGEFEAGASPDFHRTERDVQAQVPRARGLPTGRPPGVGASVGDLGTVPGARVREPKGHGREAGRGRAGASQNAALALRCGGDPFRPGGHSCRLLLGREQKVRVY